MSDSTSSNIVNIQDAAIGCLLGTAVGDALGLPLEGLPRRRQKRLFPRIDKYHFMFGRGMTSDDTEHTCMVAQSLIASGDDVEEFTCRFSRELKLWLLGWPAGAGLATVKATSRLLLGIPPGRSGLFSAGNGPAMRSAIIGVFCGKNLDLMRKMIKASTRITHTDPKAEYGALAVAIAASVSARYFGEWTPDLYSWMVAEMLGEDAREFADLVKQAAKSAASGKTTQEFAESIGQGMGVSGYVYATVPAALHAWLRHPHNYSDAVMEVIECGGDTDSTAAIVGGIVGAGTGKTGIPNDWLEKLAEWPRSVDWMESLGAAFAGVAESHIPQETLNVSMPGILIRNLVVLLVVILHGFRRLLPPY